jgi:hypothetical protein
LHIYIELKLVAVGIQQIEVVGDSVIGQRLLPTLVSATRQLRPALTPRRRYLFWTALAVLNI